eukprot:scaffold67899_cov32-Phaeocystis_antarctica.AAC.1
MGPPAWPSPCIAAPPDHADELIVLRTARDDQHRHLSVPLDLVRVGGSGSGSGLGLESGSGLGPSHRKLDNLLDHGGGTRQDRTAEHIRLVLGTAAPAGVGLQAGDAGLQAGCVGLQAGTGAAAPRTAWPGRSTTYYLLLTTYYGHLVRHGLVGLLDVRALRLAADRAGETKDARVLGVHIRRAQRVTEGRLGRLDLTVDVVLWLYLLPSTYCFPLTTYYLLLPTRPTPHFLLPASCFLVPGSWFLVPGSWFLVPTYLEVDVVLVHEPVVAQRHLGQPYDCRLDT